MKILAPEYIRALRLKSWQMIHEVSGFVVSERLRQLNTLLAKYSPTQPRVPAGDPAGGQWTSGGGGGGIVPERPRGGAPGTVFIPQRQNEDGYVIEEFPRPKPGGMILDGPARSAPSGVVLTTVPGRSPTTPARINPQAAFDAAIGGVIGQAVGTFVNALGDVFASFSAMVKDAFGGFDMQFPVPDTSNLTLEQLNALTPEQASQLTPQQVNIFIGGADDEDASFGGNHPVLNSDALRYDVPGHNIYTTHDSADKISAAIQKLPPNVEVNVIGHSLGGATAAQVALNNPGRINKLITIDPVGPLRLGIDQRTKVPVYDYLNSEGYQKVRSGVNHWVDVYASGRPGAGDASNRVAWLGRRWTNEPNGYASIYVNAAENHGNFDKLLRTKLPNGWRVLDIIRP